MKYRTLQVLWTTQVKVERLRTYIDFACPLNNLKLLLHEFFGAACVISIVPSCLQECKFLMAELFTTVVIFFDLAQDLLFHIFISTHDSFDGVSFLLAGEVLLLFLKSQVVITAFSLLLKFNFFFCASMFDLLCFDK